MIPINQHSRVVLGSFATVPNRRYLLSLADSNAVPVSCQRATVSTFLRFSEKMSLEFSTVVLTKRVEVPGFLFPYDISCFMFMLLCLLGVVL